jgi:hypothetical protein
MFEVWVQDEANDPALYRLAQTLDTALLYADACVRTLEEVGYIESLVADPAEYRRVLAREDGAIAMVVIRPFEIGEA